MRAARRLRLVTRLRLRDGHDCCICGGQISDWSSSGDPGSVTLEHLVPKSKGGGDSLDNLALAHRSCNNGRGISERGAGAGLKKAAGLEDWFESFSAARPW